MDFRYSLLQENDLESDDKVIPSKSRRLIPRSLFPAVLCHLVILALYSAAFGYFAYSHFLEKQVKYSPANEAIQYQETIFGDSINASSIYVSNPSVEVDQAWNELLHGIGIRLTDKELQKLGASSIALVDDEGGFWSTLTVKHDLHCLNMMRWYMAPEVYRHKFKSHHIILEPGDIYPKHISHCMERMRQFIMCNADVTPLTFYWKSGEARAVTNYTATRTCANWEKIHQWSVEHSFELGPEAIQNPEFGYPYSIDD